MQLNNIITNIKQAGVHFLSAMTFLLLAACGAENPPTDGITSSESSAPASSAQSSSSSVSNISTLIEVDDTRFCPFNGLIETQHAGFNGTGYANGANANGNTLTWSINITTAATYQLKFTYANGSDAERPGNLSANNKDAFALQFASTGGWDAWQSNTFKMPLQAGQTLVSLSATSDSGLPNIDSLEIIGPAEIGFALCPEQGPLTVWLAGDSTVANGQTPCPVGWGKTFAEFFNDKVTVQNYAAGGRSVLTWLYDVTDTMGSDGECQINRDNNGNRILQSRWQSMSDQMKQGDYLFIQFGINDGSPTCPRHVGEAAFKDEFRMMAQTALDKGAHPILVTPSPAIRCSGSTAVANRGFINAVFEVANQMEIPVIDLHQLGITRYNQLAFCPVAGGGVSAATTGAVGEFFCDDHTHFDYPGAREMGALITNELKSQFIPLAEYLVEQ